MERHRYPTKPALGEAAAAMGAEAIRDAMAAKDRANITIATGASRFEELDGHIGMPEIRPDRNNPRKEPGSCVQDQETR
jgi:6-phosphogluconolactonase/glucosamine-6-phosphate isomerase/deaminase